ncbi:ABC transporter permease [Oceanimonas sp. GK1]|uniref:ABC transporter permease n=1 Tax=Oceanimonas sp. (strain GK1 / IBRC-M 10197) TaxID=511062 RepID=UPI0002494EA8|nr:ABC transporter permease [Oceanimonas sp. GK1]AEY00742.1 ABC transporter permease [Oceanimonas sp. GK1]
MATMLNRKLRRDLWQIRGQALAIGLVVALGVMLLVMMHGLVNSLGDTRDSYYQRYRLAEVFAPVKRAPKRLLRAVSALPGVALAEGRIIGAGRLTLPTEEVPIPVRLVSLPGRINQLRLTAGRLPEPVRQQEVLLLNTFAKAQGLRPGDRLELTLNGRRERLTVVGLAMAPEFLYVTPPGELVPDDGRFAVIWMHGEALADALDLNGAVNEFLIRHSTNIPLPALIAALDRLLAPYGALGAYPRAEHLSDRFIHEEIDGLRVSARILPPVFLGVAAFLLYIMLSRMVQAEREQIGLLKAFGHSNPEVGLHYLRFVLVIALGGALAGVGLGYGCGYYLAGVYQLYYHFPYLMFRIEPEVLLLGTLISMAAASAGCMLVLRRVWALAPVAAMRPPVPTDFSRSLRFGPGWRRWLDQPARMVLRQLWRRPVRALLTVLGIALGMALSVAMLTVMSGFEQALNLQFGVIDRSDATLTFTEPRGSSSLYALGHVPGVVAVEGVREVPVILRHDRRYYRGAVTGLTVAPQLYRALDNRQRPLRLEGEGLVLARPLATRLDIAPGQLLRVEVREGRRPVLTVPVTAVADTLLGAPAFMSLAALNRAMKEPDRVSGAYLRLDRAQQARLYRELKTMPVVAGVSLRAERRAAFRQVMDSGAGATRYIISAMAGIITFGIVFNAARVAFAERTRELACLRILGMTSAETGLVLLGELGGLTLAALPLGSLLGYGLSQAAAAGFSTELYQVSAELDPASHVWSVLTVLVSAAFSAVLVQRDINRLDLVSAQAIRD